MNIPSLQIEAKRLPTIFFVIELDACLLGGQCHEIGIDMRWVTVHMDMSRSYSNPS